MVHAALGGLVLGLRLGEDVGGENVRRQDVCRGQNVGGRQGLAGLLGSEVLQKIDRSID